MAARVLPRPTRTDLWITAVLLTLSVAVAIAAPGVIVALSADLWVSPLPVMTGVFVWSVLLPTIPVMLLGQVWLYRMTRRPAAEPTFFA